MPASGLEPRHDRGFHGTYLYQIPTAQGRAVELIPPLEGRPEVDTDIGERPTTTSLSHRSE